MTHAPNEVASPDTTDALFTEVYDRLKAMAARQRARAQAPGGLATTELVHELYLRMGSGQEKLFDSSAKFFAYAARAMRHVLIDAARQQIQRKAGGDQLRLSLTDPAVHEAGIDPGLALQLDAALVALEAEDPRAARVVELHYFAGLEFDRVSELLGVHRRTIERDWRYARAFLAERTSA